MTVEKALTIPGWMSEPDLLYLAHAASRSSLIAEVGSWLGRSTAALAANTHGQVYAFDTWRGSACHQPELAAHPENWLMDEFLNNMRDLPNVRPRQMTSTEAAEACKLQAKKFDLIFIDADHEYESIKADILAWQPLLAENGILSGHDYAACWPGVRRAVEELIPNFRVIDAIWTTETA